MWRISRAAAARTLASALALALPALAAPGAQASLTFGGCFRDGAIAASRAPACTGLATLDADMSSIEFPPGDASQVYATAGLAGATIFSRDPSTGALAYSGCVPTNLASGCPGSGGHEPIGAIGSLAFSANGAYAYASDSYSVNWFSRDPSSGSLAFDGCIVDAAGHALFPETSDCGGNLESGIGLPQDLTITPDGQQLYVASPQTESIASIEVNPSTGALSAGQCASAGPTVRYADSPTYSCPVTVAQLKEAYGVTVSADGSSVYATGLGDGAIVPFTRASTAGHPLSAQPCVASEPGCATTLPSLARATNAQLSSDGRTLTVGTEEGIVSFFSREASTGALTFAGCLEPAGTNVPGCTPDPAGPGGGGRAYLTPDGADLYVTGTVYRPSEILQIYARNAATGFLSYVGCLRDAANTPAGIGAGCEAVDGLYGIGELTSSPDGRFLYGVSGDYGLPDGGGTDPYGAVVWFARTPDAAPSIAPPAPAPGARASVSGGSAKLPLSCPAGVTAYCDATVSISPVARGALAGAARTASVHVAQRTSSGRLSVTLRLPAALLRGARAHRVRSLRVTVTRLNANGTKTTTHHTVRVVLAAR